jgi:hypothetical protein
MDITQLDNLYGLYKFQLLPIVNKDIRVYSFTNKYFSNADIIVLRQVPEQVLQNVAKQIEDLGFSVKIRDYKTLEEAEESLFDGFFDIERSNKLLAKSYEEYTQKIEKVLFGKYDYIKSEYTTIEDNVIHKGDIVQTILQTLKTTGPVLVLLEAAAGFGKTSTSYELIKHLSIDISSKKVPLFTELSRNRQASIFKYVLYDEINARFTGLSLELVIKHIIDGRIPIIIDGFDELLKPKNAERKEDKFEDAEPMLETIKELLKGEAKIVLTTRRTAIFSDDEFFKWLDDNNGSFTFHQYSISEPAISDWIAPSREKSLQKAGLNLKSISNPVLLAYLRSMNDEKFNQCVNDVDRIIDEYVIKLMERENERQELNMSIEEQKIFLKIMSSHFTNADVTSETKELLEKKILEQEQNLLFQILDRFSPDKRPTIDQLINKLTIHAFLDRKGDIGHQIGFVNDFILGAFVGANLLDEEDLWIGTERFIDFILTAYIPRNANTRLRVYELLNRNLLTYLDSKKQVFIDNYLFGKINRNLDGDFFSDLEFRGAFDNNSHIKGCIFSECEFFDIDFKGQIVNAYNLYFINCNFFNCNFVKQDLIDRNITFTNCNFTPPNDLQESQKEDRLSLNKVEIEDSYEKKVLEKFWQSGKDRFIPNKRLTTLRLGCPPEEVPFIDDAIEHLIKLGYILQRKGHHSLQLNIEYINEIKQILGR